MNVQRLDNKSLVDLFFSIIKWYISIEFLFVKRVTIAVALVSVRDSRPQISSEKVDTILVKCSLGDLRARRNRKWNCLSH
jgi:hypothetical protein